MSTLAPDEIQLLAGAGKMMLYIVHNFTGISNLNQLQLADYLRNNLDNSSTGSVPAMQVVGMATGNDTLQKGGADQFLSLYDNLPTNTRDLHGKAGFWISMVAISGLAIGLRFYTRIRLAGGMKRDDWTLLAAWFFATALNIEEIYRLYTTRWENHVWFLNLDELKLFGLLGTIDNYLFFVATALYKIALLMFFYGLSTNFFYRLSAWVLFVLTLAQTAFSAIFVSVFCKPIDTWNHPFEVKCVPNGRDFLIAIMCGNMVIDILILALPLSVAYKLDLRRAEKAMLMGLIGLGSFVCICSIMRITCVDPYVTSNDSTWAIMPLVDWTVLEVHLGIVTASAPMLRKLLLQIIPALRSFSSKRLSSTGSPQSETMKSAKEEKIQPQRDAPEAQHTAKEPEDVEKTPGASNGTEIAGQGKQDDSKSGVDILEMVEREEDPVRYHYSFDDMRVVRAPRD